MDQMYNLNELLKIHDLSCGTLHSHTFLVHSIDRTTVVKKSREYKNRLVRITSVRDIFIQLSDVH